MWYFTSPEIIFGEGALNALDDLPGKHALIVTDSTLVQLGLVEKVTRHLKRAGITFRIFDEVEPDPSVQTVRAGAEVARYEEPDWVVGLGGGSAMDAAKAIWVLYERPEMEPTAINPVVRLGLRKKARLLTLPTTSGTGAEVTWAIVLTDTDAQRKLSLGNRENTADIAIVDPEMVMAMPPQLTADTGMDALTHAIEGYTCTWHTDMTDGLCQQAIRLIVEFLPRAHADGSDREARARMHHAATLAGLGFGNALASMAHAMGHALGAIFHVPHGRAVGLMLPTAIEFIASESPARFADLAELLGWGDRTQKASAQNLADRIRKFNADLGQPTTIQALGISKSDYDAQTEKLIDDAFNDASMMASARPPSYEELQTLFLKAYLGREANV